LEPAEVTRCHRACGREEVLVHWSEQSAADASWVLLDEFHATYPSFQLADELILQAGRDVMYDTTYQWRRKSQQKGVEEIERIVENS
jgi:hypothetical protein